MSSTSLPQPDGTEGGAHDSARGRPKVKRIALKPPAPGALPERERERYADERPDPHASLRKQVGRGEQIATPGGKQQSGDRDIHDEEWRAHDGRGPYGQRRRRRN